MDPMFETSLTPHNVTLSPFRGGGDAGDVCSAGDAVREGSEGAAAAVPTLPKLLLLLLSLPPPPLLLSLLVLVLVLLVVLLVLLLGAGAGAAGAGATAAVSTTAFRRSFLVRSDASIFDMS